MIRIPILLAATFFAACATPRPPDAATTVELRLRPDSVMAGETLSLVLENGSDDEIGYNLCPTALERREGDAWQPVPSERACTLELRTLEPRGSARSTLELPPSLAPGEYRGVTSVEVMRTGATRPVRSEPIQVLQRGP